MGKDPLSMFGGLTKVCIREDYEEDRRALAEGVVLMALGAASSVLTAYVLASLGLLV
jgi:hypothetical protein